MHILSSLGFNPPVFMRIFEYHKKKNAEWKRPDSQIQKMRIKKKLVASTEYFMR